VESTLFRARRRLSAEYDEIVTGERCRRTHRLITSLALGESVGARDKRQLSRHIAYCQPCRRQARRAGVEPAAVAEVKRRVGLAAFLPFPFLRRRGGAAESAVASGHVSTVAQWTANVGSSLDPIIASWSKAVAAAATIALAGAGASVATHHRSSLRGVPDGVAGLKSGPVDYGNGSTRISLPVLRERPVARAGVPAAAKPQKKADDEASALFLDPTGQLPSPPPAPGPGTDPINDYTGPAKKRLPTAARADTRALSAVTGNSTVAAVTAIVDQITGDDAAATIPK
jgi:hypothetical protein